MCSALHNVNKCMCVSVSVVRVRGQSVFTAWPAGGPPVEQLLDDDLCLPSDTA